MPDPRLFSLALLTLGLVLPPPVMAQTPAPAPEMATPELRAAEGVVYLTEEQGWQRLLAAEESRDFFLLSSYAESERFLTFCAIASMAAALNSLDVARPLDPARYPYPFYTQDNIFVLANEAVKSYEQVLTEGLTLDEIGRFLGNLPATPKILFADTLDPDTLRTAIMAGLAEDGARVLANYDRAVLGQVGAGHVSPIGAYDAESDSVLILDVARYKYPPAWVPVALLHKAMLPADPGSGGSRGLALVRPAA